MERQSKKGTVKSFDGTGLNYSIDTLDNARAIIVIVHGLAEHQGRYEYLKDKLNSFGYSVYRYDNRGHGKSGGERGYFADFNEIIDDVNFIVNLTKRENPHLPIYVLGHSMGGFAVTGFGVKYPGKVNGLILSGAATADNAGITKTIPIDLDSLTMIPNNLSSLVSKDQAVVKAYENDPLVLKEITVGLFYQMSKGIEWLKTNVKKFNYPVLILHGSDDKLVSPEDSHQLYENISSTDKEIKIYNGLYHEILNESIKDKIIEDIHTWIENRIV